MCRHLYCQTKVAVGSDNTFETVITGAICTIFALKYPKTTSSVLCNLFSCVLIISNVIISMFKSREMRNFN